MGTKAKFITITEDRLRKRGGSIHCDNPNCGKDLKMGALAYITSGGRIVCRRCLRYTKRMQKRAEKDILGKNNSPSRLANIKNYY